MKKDEFNIRDITHEDLAKLPNEVRNRIYGVNDYKVDKYASDIWKSIIKDPADLINEIVELKIFELGPKKIKYTRRFNTSLSNAYSDYTGDKDLSDFENDLERRRVAVKNHVKRLGMKPVNETQLRDMALVLLIKSGFWMMDYNNNGDFFVPRRWEREEFQVTELTQGRKLFLDWNFTGTRGERKT